jgi:hypothetical protein
VQPGEPARSRRPRPTASSKRLLNGALPASNGTFSTLTPHSGHFTRYTSMNTVVRNALQGRSRTARSLTSHASVNLRPHPEHSSLRFPRLRRTQSFSAFPLSSISCR